MPTKTTPPHHDALLSSAAAPVDMPASALAFVPAAVPASWRDRVFLTLDEASAVSGVSVGTLRRLHHRGLLRLHRIGGRTMVMPADLVAAVHAAAEPWGPEKHGTRGAAARAARHAAAIQPAEAA